MLCHGRFNVAEDPDPRRLKSMQMLSGDSAGHGREIRTGHVWTVIDGVDATCKKTTHSKKICCAEKYNEWITPPNSHYLYVGGKRILPSLDQLSRSPGSLPAVAFISNKMLLFYVRLWLGE